MKIYACVLSALLIGGIFAVDVSAKSAKKSVSMSINKPSKSMTAAGTVLSVDMVGNTITVEGKGKKKPQWIFSVPVNARILIQSGKKSLTLADISAGAKVSVKYYKDGDTLNASLIRVWPTKK